MEAIKLAPPRNPPQYSIRRTASPCPFSRAQGARSPRREPRPGRRPIAASGARPRGCQKSILRHSRAAVRLNGPIQHLQRHFGATTLIIAISVRAALLPTCPSCTRLSASAAAPVRSPSAIRRCPREWSLARPAACPKPRGPARACTSSRARARPRRYTACSDGCAPARAALRNLESAAFAKQHVRRRHADISKCDLGMPVRRMIVAEDAKHALDFHSGRVHRHQDHRLLFVRWGRGSVLPMKMAILQRGSPAPEIHHFRPLITYSSPSRTILRFDVRGIRGSDAGSVIAKHERISPASSGFSQRSFLFGRAVTREHFHVARVRRGAIETSGATGSGP